MENFHFPHTYYLFVCYSTLYRGAFAYTRNSGSLYSLALSSLSSTFFLFFLCLCFLCRSGLWDLCDRWCRVSFTSGGRGGTMVNFGTFWGTSCTQQKKIIINIFIHNTLLIIHMKTKCTPHTTPTYLFTDVCRKYQSVAHNICCSNMQDWHFTTLCSHLYIFSLCYTFIFL